MSRATLVHHWARHATLRRTVVGATSGSQQVPFRIQTPGHRSINHLQRQHSTSSMPSTVTPASMEEMIEVTLNESYQRGAPTATGTESQEAVASSCASDVEPSAEESEEDEMEQEEMFVEPHVDFVFRTKEWGGPRRGGRFLEPTRFGDWERKGRCTDF